MWWDLPHVLRGVADDAGSCLGIVVAPFEPEISASRRAEQIANSKMGSMRMVERASRRAKYSRSRASSSGVGRRARRRGLPISL
jgi:hypothetical protein